MFSIASVFLCLRARDHSRLADILPAKLNGAILDYIVGDVLCFARFLGDSLGIVAHGCTLAPLADSATAGLVSATL